MLNPVLIAKRVTAELENAHFLSVKTKLEIEDVVIKSIEHENRREALRNMYDSIFKKDTYPPDITKVIINKPAVIVMWSDNTKTVVKCQKGDKFDAEKGFAIAVAKKLYGNSEFGKELARLGEIK